MKNTKNQVISVKKFQLSSSNGIQLKGLSFLFLLQMILREFSATNSPFLVTTQLKWSDSMTAKIKFKLDIGRKIFLLEVAISIRKKRKLLK